MTTTATTTAVGVGFALLPSYQNRFVPPSVSIDDEEQEDEFSEQSPEPSPLAPPEPQQLQMDNVADDNGDAAAEAGAAALHPPLSVSSIRRQASSPGQPPARSPAFASSTSSQSKHKGDRGNGGDHRIMTLCTLPEAPSPYSPPPPSLFSVEGEEGEGREPSTSRRSNARHQRPMREVHLDSIRRQHDQQQMGKANEEDDNDDDLSSSAADVSTTFQQRPTASALSGGVQQQQQQRNLQHTPDLLPALTQLKQDLLSSHQALFLLQEENKALNRRYETEQQEWQEQQTQMLVQERKQVERRLHAEHEKVTEDLQSQLEEADQKNLFLNDQIVAIQNELNQTQNMLRDQKNETRLLQEELEQVKAALADAHKDNQSLRKREQELMLRKQHELTAATSALQLEVDYWKRELSVAHQEYREHLAKAQHSSQGTLREHLAALDKAHATIAELRAEKLALCQELLETKIRRLAPPVACQTGNSLLFGDDDDDDDKGKDGVFSNPSGFEDQQQLQKQQDQQQVDTQSGPDFRTPANKSQATRVSDITEENLQQQEDGEPQEEQMPSLLDSSSSSIQEDSGILEDEDNKIGNASNHMNDSQFQRELNAMREKHEEELRQFVRARQVQEEQQISSPSPSKRPSAAAAAASMDAELPRRELEERMRQVEQEHQKQLAEMKEQLIREVTQAALRAVVFSLGSRGVTPTGAAPAQGPSLSTQTNVSSNLVGSPQQIALDSPGSLLESMRDELTRSVAEVASRVVEGSTEEQAGRHHCSPKSPEQQSPQQTTIQSDSSPASAENISPAANSLQTARSSRMSTIGKSITPAANSLQTAQSSRMSTIGKSITPAANSLQTAQSSRMSTISKNTTPAANSLQTARSSRMAAADDDDERRRARQARREKELLTLKREWQQETNELLTSIQRECNEVFERNRTQQSRTSPRTVALPDLSMYDHEGDEDIYDLDDEHPQQESLSADYTYEARLVQSSSSFGMDLDKTLDETEALVRSLMGVN